MSRFTPSRLAFTSLCVLAMVAGREAPVSALQTPTPFPTSAVIRTRIDNDCPSSTVTTVNNYPALISIDDANLDCHGFANRHNWRFSVDGTHPASFDNTASFRYGADLVISGTGDGNAGLEISPWFSHPPQNPGDTGGIFNVRSTDGEIACFGGRLPFYSFTAHFGLHYAKGNPIHLEIIYEPHSVQMNPGPGNPRRPGTIEYRVSYLGTDYPSGPIEFDEGNVAEGPVHGNYGILNDAWVGGHFQAFLTPDNLTNATATFTNIFFVTTPDANSAVVKEREFNDCPSSTVTSVNNYPSLISIQDENLDCHGFANLHVWNFSEDGTTPAIFNNDAEFRFSADLVVEGDGKAEAGLRLSPWYGQNVDGRLNVRIPDGEIAAFGGALPFYSFTGNFGLHYHAGDAIHLEIIYDPNSRTAADPATIIYNVSYLGTDYTSGPIDFGPQNLGEDANHACCGMLNDGRAGGHFAGILTPDNPTTAKATWTNIEFFNCKDAVSFKVEPKDLNLKSHHKWVTVIITPAPPLMASDIDVASLRLNGIPISPAFDPKIEDHDGKLKVKFARADLAPTLIPGKHTGVHLIGTVGECVIDAVAFIKVKAPKMHKPDDDDDLVAGSVSEVTWDPDPDSPAATVTLMSTFDDGATWNVEADNIANTGSYMWNVPSTMAASVRLAVVTVYDQDESGYVNDSEFAESGRFSIVSATGVGAQKVEFGLRGVNPNPGSSLNVTFSLTNAGPATLAVYDVSGRLAVYRQVGSLGPGMHTLRLGDGNNLAAGLYVVRLSQGGRSLSVRAAIVR